MLTHAVARFAELLQVRAAEAAGGDADEDSNVLIGARVGMIERPGRLPERGARHLELDRALGKL